MTQGGQALKSSLVAQVAAQKGGAGAVGAVGALSLNVTKVDGSFTQGKAKSTSGGQQQGGPGGGGSSGQPQVQGGGAGFDVNSYSVAGVDVTDQAARPG
ncbi:hypothetical protein Scel_64840 [Streptomyces cellostaticus]|nr:hypothetical protein Scel_64840 [Streptomyces cellostaticus]